MNKTIDRSMFQSDDKPCVLVTGGSGYVGGHICKALSEAGYLPVNIDRQETAWSNTWGPFHKMDFRYIDKVDPWLCGTSSSSQYNVCAVIHCAANSLVGPSVSDPKLYYENNVIGTINFLNYLGSRGINNFVFSSSSSVYGNQEIIPINEDFAELRPLTSYGRSKQIIEGVLKDYNIAYDFRSVALRYFNACGADFDQEVGQVKDATHVIARILESIINDETFTIFGNDYDTYDGTCIRDYTHVWDLALAHVSAVDYLIKGGPSEVLNLGAGEGQSVKDIIDEVNETVGRLPKIKQGDRRAGDPEIVVADIWKAKHTLGWAPQFSDLNTIVETAWKWYNSNMFNTLNRKTR